MKIVYPAWFDYDMPHFEGDDALQELAIHLWTQGAVPLDCYIQFETMAQWFGNEQVDAQSAGWAEGEYPSGYGLAVYALQGDEKRLLTVLSTFDPIDAVRFVAGAQEEQAPGEEEEA